MKMFKSLNVGGYVYDLDYPYDFDEISSIDGVCRGLSQTIRVCDRIKVDDQYMLEVLLHESFHAVDYVFLGEIMTEEMVTLLSRAWLQVLADNRELLKFYHPKPVKPDELHVPEKVKVGAYNIKVVYPYEFQQVDNSLGSINVDQCCIRLPGVYRGFGLSPDCVLTTLVYLINLAILDYYFTSDYEYPDQFNLQPFSNGLYLLFKHNNFERMVQDVFGAV